MTRSTAGSTVVTDNGGDQESLEARGLEIQRRRMANGMSVRELAEQSKVGRAAITAAEEGRASLLTYVRLETWLDRFAAETGVEEIEPEGHQVEFEISGDFGVRVVVRGPITDSEELERSVSRIIRNIRNGGAQG